MYKPINGWTKAKILDVIKARPFEGRALRASEGTDLCAYLSPDGNKCAVGMFLPDGHSAQQYNGSVNSLLDRYPELEANMPLYGDALSSFQTAHDHFDNAKENMIKWVEQYVDGDV